MKAYVGQTRSASLIAELAAAGVGECTVREEFPPRRTPWLWDNGAYVDWKAGRPWSAAKWAESVTRLHASGVPRPDFIVSPDIVAGGAASLAFSRLHVFSLRHIAPVYLAVLNGQTFHEVRESMHLFAGVFVGGTSEWKEHTAERWVRLAHSLGKPCHIGRAGTVRKVWWAKRIGADSVDSSFPLWTRARVREFIAALQTERDFKQFEMHQQLGESDGSL